jgi:hypothetical protein
VCLLSNSYWCINHGLHHACVIPRIQIHSATMGDNFRSDCTIPFILDFFVIFGSTIIANYGALIMIF